MVCVLFRHIATQHNAGLLCMILLSEDVCYFKSLHTVCTKCTTDHPCAEVGLINARIYIAIFERGHFFDYKFLILPPKQKLLVWQSG